MLLIRLCYLSDLPSAEDLGKLLLNPPVSTSTANVSPLPLRPIVQPEPQLVKQNAPQSFEELLRLVATAREPLLYSYLMQDVHLVSFKIGHIELRLNDRAPKTLMQDLTKLLLKHTGETWQITSSTADGQSTIAEQKKAAAQAEEDHLLQHETIQTLKDAFPQATLKVSKI